MKTFTDCGGPTELIWAKHRADSKQGHSRTTSKLWDLQ